MSSEAYRAQVDLMLQTLPHVAKEKCFSLKGGTAINLFVRNMPRLSVDIDLTYLPFDQRVPAMTAISVALRRMRTQIENSIPGSKAGLLPQSDGQTPS